MSSPTRHRPVLERSHLWRRRAKVTCGAHALARRKEPLGLRISDLRGSVEGGRKRVSADLVWETRDHRPDVLFFETDEPFAAALGAEPDAFLLAAAPLATWFDESRIIIEASGVSPRVLNELSSAVTRFESWLPGPLPGEVHARPRPVLSVSTSAVDVGARARSASDRNVGLFFSGGVDSLAELRENHQCFARGDRERIRDLIFVSGLNSNDFRNGVPLPERSAHFERTRSRLASFATATETELVPVYTNLRSLYPSFAAWHTGVGAGTIAAGLTLTGRIRELRLGSSGDCRFSGWHSDLDASFSTESVDIRLSQANWTRQDKLASLAEWPRALDCLRTCFHIELPDEGRLNCGRCEKCLRTMIGLLTLGRLGEASGFPGDDLSPEMIEAVHVEDEIGLAFWSELVGPLVGSGRTDLANAVRGKLPQLTPPWLRSPTIPTGIANLGRVGLLSVVPDRWDAHWQRRHHLLSRMTRFMEVGWVAPPEHWRYRQAPRTDIEPPTRMAISDAATGLPTTNIPSWVAPAQLSRRVRSVRRALERRGCDEIVLELWRPEFQTAVDLSEYRLTCYHVDDEYSWAARPSDREEELVLLRSVDQVFVSSPGLFDSKSLHNPSTTLVPNGVDYRAYSAVAPEPEDLRGIPRPRAGYVGVLKYALDWALLTALADRHADWSFVLAGPIQQGYRFAEALATFKRRTNVYVLPARPPLSASSYPQHFDVCLMPYAALTYMEEYGYPLKLHEYLASGRPVVGSPMRSLLEYSEVVGIARGVNEWSRALLAAVESEPDYAGRRARLAVARQHDWDILARRVAEILANRLEVELPATASRSPPDGRFV